MDAVIAYLALTPRVAGRAEVLARGATRPLGGINIYVCVDIDGRYVGP